MWFINFVLAAGICISLLLYGWVSYLERTAAAGVHPSASAASVPMPQPKPPLAKAQSSVVETEIVREPKAGEGAPKERRQQKQVSGRPTW